MKIITLMLTGLISLSLYANSISTYKGRVYSNQNMQKCEKDYTAIADRLEANQDFKIIEGGCNKVSESRITLNFTYAHPTAERIESYTKNYNTIQACELASLNAETTFTNSNMQFLQSYCNRNELNTNYLSLNGYILNSIFESLSFTTSNKCHTFLKDLKRSLAKYDINTLFGSCSQENSTGNTKRFIPEVKLSVHFTKNLKVISGQPLNPTATCFDQYQTINGNFDRSHINLAHTLCAAPKYNGKKREVLFYITNSKSRYVRTLKLSTMSNLRECEIKSKEAMKNLEAIGKRELYTFCKGNYSRTFTPVIYYTEKRLLDL